MQDHDLLARRASRYEASTSAFNHVRRRIVELLPLQPGGRVLDVGCGTGLCLDLLRERVGAGGRVIGVDPSPEMLTEAGARVRERGWENVTLLRVPAEELVLAERFDAVLLCAVHDVMQSAPALSNVLRHVRPGGSVAAGGGKWASPWAGALNAAVALLHRPYVRDFRGFDRPWRLLADLLDGLQVREIEMGAGYLAWGRTSGP